ncbi:nucleotide pyrophosphohydrolase [Fictibacillus sp. WQ 8-8]|nr:nucleotide pyrophosphohydrolase [Fictibacillus sp. WQ 8-8]MCQ6267581.1 nucleotide pyrophosphohydrolase [Fictibacillus sp. WQ 8-8]
MMQHLIDEIRKFRDERNWGPHHNPKDLSLSISLEAAELLENFQWKESQEAVDENLEDIKDELADVIIYSLQLADRLDVDVNEIVRNKMEKNAVKYPVK